MMDQLLNGKHVSRAKKQRPTTSSAPKHSTSTNVNSAEKPLVKSNGTIQGLNSDLECVSPEQKPERKMSQQEISDTLYIKLE